MNAVIIAGGRATRLGPLTAQMNKALVSIGQRPIIIHQLELLREAGAKHVVVVVSPESKLQVQDVIERSLGKLLPRVTFVVQPAPNGPADAVMIGVDALGDWNRPTTVIMADTFIDEPIPDGDWIGVGPAPASRSWCYFLEGHGYIDDEASEGRLVTIGVYRFTDTNHLYHSAVHACKVHMKDREAPMSTLLNEYSYDHPPVERKIFKTWLDVGDVPALAAAKRKRFITREFNRLELTSDGRLLKHGHGEEFEREAKWYKKLDEIDRKGLLLFPRLTDYREHPYPADKADDWDARHPTLLGLEHVDLPTLAELYLYWPGRPDMWSSVVTGIVQTLREKLWEVPVDQTSSDEDHEKHLAMCAAWGTKMYRDKPKERLRTAGFSENDCKIVDRIYANITDMDPVSTLVSGHGDLNFGNILYSLSTMTFKLIDPRGDDWVDVLYEFAKLRYCYRDHFSSITHNLFTFGPEGRLLLGPDRREEADAIDAAISKIWPIDWSLVQLIEATIFLSAVPLHPVKQGRAMYLQALKLTEEVLGVPAIA